MIDGYCTCYPELKGRTADCGVAAHRNAHGKAARWRIESVPARSPRRWRWRVIDLKPEPPYKVRGIYFDTSAEAFAAFARGGQ